MIKIVVDSGCDISQETIEKKNIFLQKIPLQLQINDKVFIDDENLDIDNYLEIMKNSKDYPKTAAPSPELYVDSFKDADVIFIITLSAKLSGSHNSANLAKKITEEQSKDKVIYLIDSKSASSGETIIALKLHEYIQAGMPHEEIYKNILEFVDNMNTYVLLEKYDNLVKNGRLNPAIAKIASMLSIKPICYAKEGEIEILDKVRGYKKAVEKLVGIITEEKGDFSQKVLSISNVKCYDKAVEIRDMILEKANFKETLIENATGLCSTYADIDGIVISF